MLNTYGVSEIRFVFVKCRMQGLCYKEASCSKCLYFFASHIFWGWGYLCGLSKMCSCHLILHRDSQIALKPLSGFGGAMGGMKLDLAFSKLSQFL